MKNFLFCCLLPLFLFADVAENYPSVAVMEPAPEEFTPVECISGYSASALYDVCDPFCIYFSADFLYWQAREDNLDYGVTTTGASFEPIVDGTVLNMEFDWHPGVKVGIGTDFKGHDCWDLFAEWTYLNSHNNGSTTLPLGKSIFPSLLQPVLISNDVSQFAKANWKLIYNTFDLNIGRPFYSGELLTMRPHAGLRASWIKQRYNATYADLNISSIISFNTNTKFDSWSIGPRFGFDTNWELPGGFKLFGNAAFSLLFTYFDMNKHELEVEEAGEIVRSSVTDKKHHNSVRANAETFLGFGWGSYFDCDNWHIDLNLGYEFQYWPDANGDIRFVDFLASGVHVTGGNLVLHGITFKARADF